MPEAAGSTGSEERASPAPAGAATADAVLGRLELELPDGRYLLSYHSLEEAAEADA